MRKLLLRLKSSPAAMLFLLAPLVGELLSSSSPLPEFLVAWLPLAALYGSGALLIRETRVRWSLGWPAVFILGAAYGIVEEGIVVRSFFDPLWEDLGLLAEYGRAGGVNWTWSHLLTLFHSAVSIAAPIALVELVFPRRRTESWIGRRGIAWCSVGVIGWVILGDAAFMNATGIQLLGAGAAVTVLSWLAFRFPAADSEPADSEPAESVSTEVPSRPKRYFWLVLATGFVTFVIPHWASQISPVHPLWPSLGMTLVPASALVAWDRWSARGTAWTSVDRSAALGGAFGFLATLVLLTGSPIPIATSVASMLIWWRWHRSVARSTEGEMLPA